LAHQSDLASGNDTEFQLTYGKRKSIGIYVSAEHGIEVRVPYFVSRKEAMSFVYSKRVWIEKQLAELERRPKPYEPQLQWGNQFYFLGEKQVIGYDTIPAVEYVVPGASAGDSIATVERKLKAWYRTQASAIYHERHDHWRQQMQSFALSASTIEPRLMKRRWGTCRSNGRILLNTNLVKYPLECIDVVVVHELCHLKEFNHSTRFYRLMTMAMPQWRRWDALLNDLSLQY